MEKGKEIKIEVLNFSQSSFDSVKELIQEDFNFTLEFESNASIAKDNYSIGKIHLNQLSLFLNVLKRYLLERSIEKGTIRFSLDSKIEQFDIAILGLISLFKIDFNSVSFSIEIDQDTPEEVFYRLRDIFVSIREWFNFSNNIYLYNLYYSGPYQKRIHQEPRGILPLLIINNEEYHYFFSSRSEQLDFNLLFNNIDKSRLAYVLNKNHQAAKSKYYKEGKKIRSITIAEINFRIIRDTISELSAELNWIRNQKAYIQQYMLMLANFDLLIVEFSNIIDLEFDFSLFEEFKKPNISFEEMTMLQEHVKEISIKLRSEPYFFTILFSVLVNRNIDKQINNLNEFKKRLNEIYEYSFSLFMGIKEIVRNIIDHTESKKGVILGRVTKGMNLQKINDDFSIHQNGINFEDYLSELSDSNSNKKEKSPIKNDFFQITIFDEGQIGIVQKTIENIDFLIESVDDSDGFFQKDIEGLKDGSILLNDFFDIQNFKLNHQAYKASAHWGLVTFTNLIVSNFGLVSVSSRNYHNNSTVDNCIVSKNHNTNFESSNFLFQYGTKYELLLPTAKSIPQRKLKVSNSIPKGINFSTVGYLDLFNFELVQGNCESFDNEKWYLISFDILVIWEQVLCSDYRKEYEIADVLSNLIVKLIDKCPNIIPVLDFEGTDRLFDHSKLLRLLGRLQLGIKIESYIIINVKDELLIGINNIMSLKNDSIAHMPKWNPKQFILIYAYKENKFGNRVYYTDILGGATISEYKLLKNKLSSTHPTIVEYSFTEVEFKFSQDTIESFNECPFFIDETGIIKNFELILKFKGKTFFECFLEYNLNSDIGNIEYGFSGYKIENSHFKLGSKTHIKDFIYAKRIFQNSFFTDRFAFQIAKYFLDNYPNESSLTLIGYGEYSQMLINRIEKIICAFFENSIYLKHKEIKSKEEIQEVIRKTIHINHNMISDIENPEFIKNEIFNDKVLVIVPINTTLSTTHKIESMVQNKIEEQESEKIPELLTPSLNLILVTHKNLESEDYVNRLNDYLKSVTTNNNIEFPYKIFYWRNVDRFRKVISVAINSKNETIRQQKYFITIESEWYLPDECKSCFPIWNDEIPAHINGILNEKPLLETDKTSVTPNLLLDLPKCFSEGTNAIDGITDKNCANNDPSVYITEKSIYSNHLTYKGSHHMHFIDPIPFYDQYKEKIENWAKNIKIELLKECPKLFNSTILLVSPSERGNTYFVELINRIIFDDSGIIIHYEVTGDYTENYQKFFSGNIKQSDYIFYVDDFIQSGRTFHLVNDFIRYCNNQELDQIIDRKHFKTCDAIFTLISKTDDFSKGDIVAQINSKSGIVGLKYNAFYYLYVDSSRVDKCPLCDEIKRYERLADISMLDTVKYYFLNKAKNLKPKDFSKLQGKSNGWLKFHPFVFENKSLPWQTEIGSNQDIIYNHFCNNILPDRNYIKFIIQNEFNRILSSNIEIRSLFKFPFKESYSIEDKINHTNKLFNSVMEEIKSIPIFISWFKLNDECITKVYHDIIEEMLIKVVTQQPYSNMKDIKEKSFFWILYKLDKAINDFILINKFNYRKFRLIKFLLRRATILGSNYIIRKKTLHKLKQIYSVYSNEVKFEIENKRLNKAKLIQSELLKITEELESKRNETKADSLGRNSNLNPQSKISITILENRQKYLLQCSRNLIYIEVSLKEFSYFFVSIVKEVTAFNDSKVLKLEQNLDSFIKNGGESEIQDFNFLLRLLKFENSFIVKNAVELIYSEYTKGKKLVYFDYKFSSSVVRKYLDEVFSLAIKDYKLNAFKTYFGIENFEEWKDKKVYDYHMILELIFIYTCLRNEEDKEFESDKEISLFDKTKSIIRNFHRIVNIPTIKNELLSIEEEIVYKNSHSEGAFIVLKTSDKSDIQVSSDNLLVAYATDPYKLEDDYMIYNVPFDNLSLSFKMLQGVSNRSDVILGSFNEIKSYFEGNKVFSGSGVIEKEYPVKPWTLWEIVKVRSDNSTFWKSKVGTIYSTLKSSALQQPFTYDPNEEMIISNDFTENLYLDDDINSIILLRLSSFDYSKSGLKIRSNAILGLFSANEFFDVERLKFSLMLLPLINQFIVKHYDSDSLKEFIEERNEKYNVLKIKHGFPRYLANLKNRAFQTAKSEDETNFIKLLYSLLTPWDSIQKMIFINKAAINKEEIDKIEEFELINMDFQSISLLELGKKIEYYYGLIVKNEIGGTAEAPENSSIHCTLLSKELNSLEIPISFSCFLIVLAEALVNAKKNIAKGNNYILSYSFHKGDNNIVFLKLTNKSNFVSKKIINILNKYNRNNKHGLGLINHISFELFKKNITVNYVESTKFEGEFTLTLPISIINED